MTARITIRPKATRASDGNVAPISDLLLSRLYRATEAEVETIAMSLPEDVRAETAVFCFARSHLREIGRQIAWMCEPHVLMRAGGARVGAALTAAMPETHMHRAVFQKPRVSLATVEDMRIRPVPALEDNAEL